MEQYFPIITVIFGLLGFVGFIISLICVAIIAGFTRSTHKVQYVPVENLNPEIESYLKDPEGAYDLEELDKAGKKRSEVLLKPIDEVLEEVSSSEISIG